MTALEPLHLARSASTFRVAADVLGMRIVMVNVYFAGTPENWSLVDTGLYFSAGRIERAARELFGLARPKSILLTHGHFDHVGAVRELAERWDVPVYAHRLELPYLTGRSKYPPPDPGVGGGSIAWMASLYPRGPIDLGPRVRPLRDDGSVPDMPGWRVIATPGHAPGHVSFFRDSDRLLLAGDAFVTTRQESLVAVMEQRRELNGPPAFYTPDWESAERSLRRLADLDPEVAGTGHGLPMRGDELRQSLRWLADHFRKSAVPRWGRYVRRPATTDENGVVSLPPPSFTPVHAAMGAVGVIAAALALSRRR